MSTKPGERGAFDFNHSTNSPSKQVNIVAEVSPEVAQSRLGLSTCHISPLNWELRPLPVFDWVEGYGDFYSYDRDCLIPIYSQQPFVHIEPKVIFTTDGTLCKVVTERDKLVTSQAKIVVSRRGNVTSFSKKSRKRLLNTLAKTDKAQVPIFVTLTYPDIFPEDDCKLWKRHLDALGKRMKRRWPDVAFVWRIELKTRKTGLNAGKIAPHYHLLVWNTDFDQLKGFLAEAWYEIVGSGSLDHLKAGTRIEYLRSRRGVMAYASKYVGKVDREQSGNTITGRHWGIVGREFLPLSDVIVTYLSQTQAIALTRIGRNLINLKGKQLRYGLTWMIDGANIDAYLRWLIREGDIQPESNITLI